MDHQPKAKHVAIISSPGMGHVIPMVQLAKHLHRIHNVKSTLVVPTEGHPSEAMKSVLSSVDHVFLQQVFSEDTEAKIETHITLIIERSLPSIRGALEALSDLSAIVIDLFATHVIDLAHDLRLPCHVFFASSASVLSLFLYLPKLDATVPGDYHDLEGVEIPGCIPIPGSELIQTFEDRMNEAYKWTVYHANKHCLVDGIMVNSFMELEPRALEVLLGGECECYGGKPRVYPVGPLVNIEASTKVSDCLGWLDSQPRGSVLYVSFGSGGTLSSAQVNELALGLEESEQRFLWVVKRPNDMVANATYFTVDSNADALFDFLPEGFLERTKGRGFVVDSWAPQIQILGHEATGGFLTHCGWNSTLESAVTGVPLIAWPLFAEQKMNAFILVHDTKVALKVKRSSETGLVEKGEIVRVTKALIEGDEGRELRNRMKDLKEAASRALTDVGASSKGLAQVVDQWNNHTCKIE